MWLVPVFSYYKQCCGEQPCTYYTSLYVGWRDILKSMPSCRINKPWVPTWLTWAYISNFSPKSLNSVAHQPSHCWNSQALTSLQTLRHYFILIDVHEFMLCWCTRLISLIFEIWTYFHKHVGHLLFLFCELWRVDRADYLFPKLILHCSNSLQIISLVYGLTFIWFMISFVVCWQVLMFTNFIKFVPWCLLFFILKILFHLLFIVSYKQLIVPMTFLN